MFQMSVKELWEFIMDGGVMKVVRQHNGRKPADGGEYGYWEYWEFDPLSMKAVVQYDTSADVPYCWKCGSFIKESDHWCHGEAMSLPKFIEMIRDLPVTFIGAGMIEFDATGHEPRWCKYEGGCTECYPCNHAKCLGGEL